MRRTQNKATAWRAGERGFTLTELMIVAAVMAVLAAIAVPPFLQSRRAAREKLAITKLAEIGAAANAFRQNSIQRRYPFLGELNDKLPGQATPYCVIKDGGAAVGTTAITITNSDYVYAQRQTFNAANPPNELAVWMYPMKDGAVDTTRPAYAVFEDGVVRTNNRPFPDQPGRTSPAAK